MRGMPVRMCGAEFRRLSFQDLFKRQQTHGEAGVRCGDGLSSHSLRLPRLATPLHVLGDAGQVAA